MRRHVILYRGREFEEEELIPAGVHFVCVRDRTQLQRGDLVIPRYSLLPYPEELHRDATRLGATLINTLQEHQYIADLREWYEDLQGDTPCTWFSLADFLLACEREPALKEKSFVLKGATNSKRNNFSSHMFAKTWQDVSAVYFRLQEDGLVGTQPIYIREFVPLVELCERVGDVPPVSEEYRFFCLYGEILCGAFYWSSYLDDVPNVPDVADVPKDWLQGIVERIQATAVVVDVGRTQDGRWQVIELNALEQSGLSCNLPATLYYELSRVLHGRSSG